MNGRKLACSPDDDDILVLDGARVASTLHGWSTDFAHALEGVAFAPAADFPEAAAATFREPQRDHVLLVLDETQTVHVVGALRGNVLAKFSLRERNVASLFSDTGAVDPVTGRKARIGVNRIYIGEQQILHPVGTNIEGVGFTRSGQLVFSGSGGVVHRVGPPRTGESYWIEDVAAGKTGSRVSPVTLLLGLVVVTALVATPAVLVKSCRPRTPHLELPTTLDVDQAFTPLLDACSALDCGGEPRAAQQALHAHRCDLAIALLGDMSQRFEKMGATSARYDAEQARNAAVGSVEEYCRPLHIDPPKLRLKHIVKGEATERTLPAGEVLLIDSDFDDNVYVVVRHDLRTELWRTSAASTGWTSLKVAGNSEPYVFARRTDEVFFGAGDDLFAYDGAQWTTPTYVNKLHALGGFKKDLHGDLFFFDDLGAHRLHGRQRFDYEIEPKTWPLAIFGGDRLFASGRDATGTNLLLAWDDGAWRHVEGKHVGEAWSTPTQVFEPQRLTVFITPTGHAQYATSVPGPVDKLAGHPYVHAAGFGGVFYFDGDGWKPAMKNQEPVVMFTVCGRDVWAITAEYGGATIRP